MEKKFKKGDRVRFIGNEGPWVEYQVTDGDEGVVEGDGYYDDEISVNFGGYADVPADDLKFIEPYNTKTAFLSEMKELLSKCDAKINCRCPDDDSMCDYPCVCIGGDTLFYISDTGITADNIMDYEKE